MRGSDLHIVFAGGVTGGHLFPGLAVAEHLAASHPGTRITFAGPGSAFDRQHVAQAGYEYFVVDAPRRPPSVARALQFGIRATKSCYSAARFLHRESVDVVIGLGGFASVPTGLAAVWQQRPLVLLEQNAVLGRANRLLVRWAHRLCLSFERTAYVPARFKNLDCARIQLSGTPVRRVLIEHAEAQPPQSRSSALSGEAQVKHVLLILGGSGGARQLNEAVPLALTIVRNQLADWHIVHQTGDTDCERVRDAYAEAGIRALATPFLENIAELMAAAQLAVCRAGGSTLAELAVARVPAILIPLAAATDDHQRLNAVDYARTGAACLVETGSATSAYELSNRLAAELGRLLASPANRGEMAAALARRSRPDAGQRIAKLVFEAALQSGSQSRRHTPSHSAAPFSIDTRAA